MQMHLALTQKQDKYSHLTSMPSSPNDGESPSFASNGNCRDNLLGTDNSNGFSRNGASSGREMVLKEEDEEETHEQDQDGLIFIKY